MRKGCNEAISVTQSYFLFYVVSSFRIFRDKTYLQNILPKSSLNLQVLPLCVGSLQSRVHFFDGGVSFVKLSLSHEKLVPIARFGELWRREEMQQSGRK